MQVQASTGSVVLGESQSATAPQGPGASREAQGEHAAGGEPLRHDTLTLPARPFRPEAKQIFDQLVSCNKHHVFIKGPDGAVRRFPRDFNAREVSDDVPEHMIAWPEMHGMEDFMLGEESSQSILDFSGPGRQASVLAGYALDPRGEVMAYEVAGQRVASLLPERAVFALPPGPSGKSQYIVCQPRPWDRSGGFACRDMLLSEGKTPAQVMELLGEGRNDWQSMSGYGDFDLFIKVLTAGWRDPIVLSLKDLPYAEGMRMLMDGLAKYGPCMLGFDQNFWVMLDSLKEEGPGHWVHRTRSPFHGTVVESHTILDAAGEKPGATYGRGTFSSASKSREPLDLALTDGYVAIFKPAPPSPDGSIYSPDFRA